MIRGARKTASLAIQGALVNLLKSDPIVMTLANGVYDAVPDGAQLPYIGYGSDTTTPDDTKTYYGEDTTVTFDIWAPGPGRVVAKRVADVTIQAVTGTKLDVPGFEVTGVELDFLEFLEDGPAYHGICRFRIYTKQN